MTNRTVIALAVGVVILALVVVLGQRPSMDGREPGPFLPGLKDSINAIDRVVVTGPGNETVATLVANDGNWTVSERNHFPAHTGQLRKLLLQLADAQIIEQKTSNAEFYDRLGVEDLDGEEAGGVSVTLSGGDFDKQIIVGDSAGSGYRYVRRADEAASWLIDQDAEIGNQVGDWLEPQIIDVEAKRVHAITISHPNGDIIRIIKASPEEQNYSVTDIPGDRPLLYEGVANVVVNLQKIEHERVVAAPADTGSGIVATEFKTFDGLIVRTIAEEVEEKPLITISAEFDPELAERFKPNRSDDDQQGPPQSAGGSQQDADQAGDDDGDEDEDEDAEQQQTAGDIAAEAQAINGRTQQWRYQIPRYKYEQLTRSWNDLLKTDDDS